MQQPKQCVVCFKKEVDRAHIKTRGSGAGWEDWEWMYLCRQHHVEQGQYGWKKFCSRYPRVIDALREKGWEINERGRVLQTKSDQ